MRWVSTLVALLACTTDAIELRPEADALTLGPEIPVPERSVRPLSNHIRRLIPGGLDVPLTKTVARKDMNFLKFLSHEAVSNSLGPIEKNSLPRADPLNFLSRRFPTAGQRHQVYAHGTALGGDYHQHDQTSPGVG
jgi:hypothetical protein